MGETPYIIKRDGIEYALYREVDMNTGDNLAYLETVAIVPEFQQRIRLGLLEIKLAFDSSDLKGRSNGISVTWGRATLAVSGVIPPDTKYEQFTLTTKFSDLKGFSKLLGIKLLTAAFNGLLADHFGQNHVRPYHPLTGAELESSYSEHLKNIPGTFDYKKWNEGDPLPEILIEPA